MKLTIGTISAVIGLCLGFLLGMGYSLHCNMKAMKDGAIIIKEVFSKMPISEAQKDLIDFADKRRELYRKTHQ